MTDITTLLRPVPRRSGVKPARRQHGVSLLLVLFICVLLFIVGGAALRAAPSVIEYRAITAAIDRAVAEGGDAAEIRRAFDRAAAIDSISSISGSDLEIDEVNGKQVVAFEYEKRLPLAGPVSLVIDYRRGTIKK